MSRPLKVELVGLIPTLFSSCARGRGFDPVALCGPVATEDQAGEYDATARAEHDAAVTTVARLRERFGGSVAPTLVGVTSPRGSWLALRHRLPPGLHAVVGGHRVVRFPAWHDTLAAVVEEELARRGGHRQSAGGPGP